MTKDFGKIIRLYLPSDQDIRDKQDQAKPMIRHSNTCGLPLAKLCPELGQVTTLKDNSDHKGGSSA